MSRSIAIAIILVLCASPAVAQEIVGVTSYGGFASSGDTNKVLLTKVTTTDAFDARFVVAHIACFGRGDTTRYYKGVLYDSDTNLVACTKEYGNNSSLFSGWQYLEFETPPSLSGSSTYWAGVWFSNEGAGAGDKNEIRVATSGGSGVLYVNMDYQDSSGTCPDHLAGASTQATWQYSIYLWGTTGDETDLTVHTAPMTWLSEDTYLATNDLSPNGSLALMRTGIPFLSPTHYAMVNFDADSVERLVPAGATFDSAYYFMTCYSASGTDTLSAWQLWKPFHENYATGGQWYDDPARGAVDSTWGLTTGNIPADSADDSGAFNHYDGTGEDRMATSMRDLVVDTTGTYAWLMDPDVWDYWISGVADSVRQGFVIGQRVPNGTSTHDWRSENATTDHLTLPGYRVFFTAASAEGPSLRRRKLILIGGGG